MRPLNFLIASFLGFFLLTAAYALFIDQVVIPERAVPFPYRQFLLESSSAVSGKVVIDSGSNSMHGIDTFQLSKYFKAPVIIIADGAAYPLRNKIFRLKKYVGKGDALILPLEWGYYTQQESLTAFFLTPIADKNLSLEYYFNELPILEKLLFIFTKYPLKIALESLLTRDSAYIEGSYLNHVTGFEKILGREDNESFGGSLLDGAEAIDIVAAKMTCDRYTSPWSDSGHFEISTAFRSELTLLKELAKSGVAIFFAWPSVVDSAMSTCYKDPKYRKNIHQFSKAIVELVEANGFKFIGELEDSHFTSECFLNTYYHLRYRCAKERTSRMIDALKREHITPLNSSHTQADLIATATEFAEKLKASLTK